MFSYVVSKAQHDLRSSVPSGGDILRHESLVGSSRLALLWICARLIPASKTKVAYLQLAIGIDEQISRFQVPVQDVCAVDIFEATEGLIDERLEVGIGERLP